MTKSTISSTTLRILIAFSYITTLVRCYDRQRTLAIEEVTSALNTSHAEPIHMNVTNDVEGVYKTEMMIIGGRPVTQGKQRYPWFAKPEITDGKTPKKSSGPKKKTIGCGGMLVSPEYVLTAAHCLKDKKFTDMKNKPGYMIGALCPKDKLNCRQKQEWRYAKEFIIHPNFDKDKRSYDVALVRLSERSTLPFAKIDDGGVSPGYDDDKFLWVVGFGTEVHKIKSPPSALKHARLSYYANEECDQYYSQFGIHISADMMCANADERSPCNGDSGGPLYDRKTDTVVGIVSWGHKCGTAGDPAVYARIATVYDWIQDAICLSHSSPLPFFCPGPEPTESPALTPTIMPTAGRANDCSVSEALFTFNLLTDNEHEFIQYDLKQGRKPTPLLTGVGHAPSEWQTEQICLKKNKRHKYYFTIRDYKRNGLCCKNGHGKYELLLNGSVIHSSQYKNKKKKERHKFRAE